MHCQNPRTQGFYFAPSLQQAGYTVGIFGKHLNSDGGKSQCYPGLDVWFANGGGNYYSPTFAYATAGTNVTTPTFSNCTYGSYTEHSGCYSTSVIANKSLEWLGALHALPAAQRKPYMAYVAVKAPHIQDGAGFPKTLPAPWYADAFPGLKAPRTPNWNASCPDHHWMIRQQPPMTAEQALNSDELYRSRFQALLSVEDMVEGVVHEVEGAGLANSTYFIFTSDHGYRFGQFRMPQGKWNVYDNDLRIPWVIRGPGIAPGTSFDHIASQVMIFRVPAGNSLDPDTHTHTRTHSHAHAHSHVCALTLVQVDTMPTILGLAGVPTPSFMDGRSMAHLLLTNIETAPAPALQLLRELGQQPPWRTDQLIEYYGTASIVNLSLQCAVPWVLCLGVVFSPPLTQQ